MCIISDRHEGIINGVEITYPDVTHGACMLYRKSHCKGETKLNREVFFGAAKAYTMQDFERNMRKLDKIDKKILDHIC